MTAILCLFSINNGLVDHCVGWARYALPNREDKIPILGSGLSGSGGRRFIRRVGFAHHVGHGQIQTEFVIKHVAVIDN